MAIKANSSNQGLDIPISEDRGANRWSQARRLEFIDFRLSCDGRINRRDLVEFFGISIPQSSLDLAKYQALVQELVPPRQNLVYDRHHKVYVKTEDYSPLYPNVCSPASYLSDLLALCRGELPMSRNYFGFVPNVGVATFSPPRRNIDPNVLYNLLEAIRSHMAVHINYMSLSSARNIDHLIAPHGLAYDGLRWHVRAYCYDIHAFRDYVLSRIMRCAHPAIAAPNDRFPDPIGNGFREVGTAGRDDAEWNELIDLVLKANPELPDRARRGIELDYGMEEGGTVVYTCRRALVFYTLKWLRLTPEFNSLPPEMRPIVLDNESEVLRRMSGGH